MTAGALQTTTSWSCVISRRYPDTATLEGDRDVIAQDARSHGQDDDQIWQESGSSKKLEKCSTQAQQAQKIKDHTKLFKACGQEESYSSH